MSTDNPEKRWGRAADNESVEHEKEPDGSVAGESVVDSVLRAPAVLARLPSLPALYPFTVALYRCGVSNEYLLAKFGVDTGENEPCKVHLIIQPWDLIFTEPPRARGTEAGGAGVAGRDDHRAALGGGC